LQSIRSPNLIVPFHLQHPLNRQDENRFEIQLEAPLISAPAIIIPKAGCMTGVHKLTHKSKPKVRLLSFPIRATTPQKKQNSTKNKSTINSKFINLKIWSFIQYNNYFLGKALSRIAKIDFTGERAPLNHCWHLEFEYYNSEMVGLGRIELGAIDRSLSRYKWQEVFDFGPGFGLGE
jgi:hypothetical protein